jgi:hypothetical protein
VREREKGEKRKERGRLRDVETPRHKSSFPQSHKNRNTKIFFFFLFRSLTKTKKPHQPPAAIAATNVANARVRAARFRNASFRVAT